MIATGRSVGMCAQAAISAVIASARVLVIALWLPSLMIVKSLPS